MRAIVISCMIIFVSLSFQQCHTIEKTAVSCPEFRGHKFNTTKTRNRSVNKFVLLKKSNLQIHKGKPGMKISKRVNDQKRISDKSVSAYLPCKTEFLNSLTVSDINSIVLRQNDCDTIFLRSGSWINAKITKKGLSRIRYRDCNNLAGPVISIPKSKIKSISYGIDNKKYIPGVQNSQRKTDPIGIIGFVFSIAGLLFLGSLSFTFISLILTGGVLGWISANRIKDHPDKLKGRGLAGISIVLGYALLIFLVLFLVIILIGKIV